MVDIINGKAETIEQALLDVLNQHTIPTNKILSFGSDGVPVMVGKRTGVATRMKCHNSEMVSIHCGAHRIALASSQAAMNVDLIHILLLFIISLPTVLFVKQLFMIFKKSWRSQYCI